MTEVGRQGMTPGATRGAYPPAAELAIAAEST